ncbi:MFS transporter [Paenibacillus albiflavus]|uniref:MFS transporter n=1 Tax=Paenibacillus albiflavus TaxID=2545760 RepID=A0A4R4ELT5_9BACL|nr:MFS transporter [Paenibacillus albiflavus]TCZ79315.1 MFS transporter [Paenibacillus albiflavus]
MPDVVKSVALDRQSDSKTTSRSRSSLTLTVMLLCTFMTVANIFIVNVGTPTIQLGLGASFSDVQFIITGYTLSFAVALIIGGRLGDRYGRKKMLIIGVVGFTITSMLCGLATSVVILTAARIIQGLSAALISPQVLSIIQVSYPPEKRGAIFGWYGAIQGLASTTGQIIGGVLLAANPWDLGWRTIFFFSIPVGLLILFLAPSISESNASEKTRFDWAGAALAATGLMLLVYPLVQGQKEGWPPILISCLILSVPVLAAFVWFEKRVLRNNRVPFVQVELFRQRVFSTGMLVAFLLMSSQTAFFLITAYLFQIGLGFTALTTGFFILPMALGYFLASLLSSRTVGKVGPYVLTIGSVLTASGYLLLALSIMISGISPTIGQLLPAMVVLGFGQGFIAAPLTNIVLAKIRRSDVGSASGIFVTGFQIASAIGICIIGILWLNGLSHQANSNDIQLANAHNYADTFVYCLYLLAAYTAFLIPLTLVLAKNMQSPKIGADAVPKK